MPTHLAAGGAADAPVHVAYPAVPARHRSGESVSRGGRAVESGQCPQVSSPPHLSPHSRPGVGLTGLHSDAPGPPDSGNQGNGHGL